MGMPERQVPRETKETEERTVHREVPEIPVPLVKEVSLYILFLTHEFNASNNCSRIFLLLLFKK